MLKDTHAASKKGKPNAAFSLRSQLVIPNLQAKGNTFLVGFPTCQLGVSCLRSDVTLTWLNTALELNKVAFLGFKWAMMYIQVIALDYAVYRHIYS